MSSIQDRHIQDATRHLLMAFHYEHFFGAPIPEFSARFNAERALANDASVRRYARKAGEYAAYSGQPLLHWEIRHPQATSIDRIADEFAAGFVATHRLLGTVEIPFGVAS